MKFFFNIINSRLILMIPLLNVTIQYIYFYTIILHYLKLILDNNFLSHLNIMKEKVSLNQDII